ncbi:MAG: transposase [Candidatus Cloacimonadales bacterium]|nr:transposase [Candidatus Cloacimonadales bacterium]
MASLRVSKDNADSIFFVTFTIRRWYYIFDRHSRWDILLSALKFYQENQNLKIYSWVFMLNHMHLIFQSENAIKFINSYKSYTAQKIRENIQDTEPKLLKLFKTEKDYQIWQGKNYPEIIESEKFFLQKAEYIITNPVRKEYVYEPEEWKFSSSSRIQLLKLESLFE